MTVDLHSFVAPYALDALDPHDRARTEAHLDQCDTCRAELIGFVTTVTRLGEAERQRPPAGLRDRLLAAVITTPQERPIVTALARRRGLRRAASRALVAAALLVGITGLGGLLTEHHHANDYESATASITAVLAAPDASTKAQAFSDGGNVRLFASATRDLAVLAANDLPELPRTQAYQVWMIGDRDAVSQGMLRRGGAVVMQGLDKANRVAITVEPSGGSRQPTTPPIAILAI